MKARPVLITLVALGAAWVYMLAQAAGQFHALLGAFPRPAAAVARPAERQPVAAARSGVAAVGTPSAKTEASRALAQRYDNPPAQPSVYTFAVTDDGDDYGFDESDDEGIGIDSYDESDDESYDDYDDDYDDGLDETDIDDLYDDSFIETDDID